MPRVCGPQPGLMLMLPCALAERTLENVASRPRLDSLSSVEEDDYDTLADIDSDKNVIRTKVRVTFPARALL